MPAALAELIDEPPSNVILEFIGLVLLHFVSLEEAFRRIDLNLSGVVACTELSLTVQSPLEAGSG